MSTDRELFWLTKSLAEMTLEEWESLCDGCARCCLYKVQYRDTGEVYYTNVACRLLDGRRCRCTSYEQRTRLVPHCLVLTPAKAGELQRLPTTCAYHRLAVGVGLEWWHPLVSGDPNTVYKAGISVHGKVVPEQCVDLDHLEEYIFYW
ncbi:MAG: YcgN family cysteine cluster protein [Deltaproteobacteria bacterium]|nr:YcgN family cysteine cluster protein [Deltaproteobacteria bacterium]